MNVEEVIRVAALSLDELDAVTREALDLVNIEVVRDTNHFGINSDAQGLFVGELSVVNSDDEDELREPPSGAIYLFASNLKTPAMVQTTLYHEIGHALGLDESEVDELGLNDADRDE